MEVIQDKLDRNMPCIFVRMTKKEALETIKSLAAQLVTGDCNSERQEHYTKDGEYFTISVADKDDE